MSEKPNFTIQRVPISAVKPNPTNPRVIKDDRFKRLVESITAFPKMLEIRPIVVNHEMIILGGNMRLRACQEAGLKTIPIIKADDLTEEQQKQFIIKDNVGFGEWDWNALANEWDDKSLSEWGLSEMKYWTPQDGADEKDEMSNVKAGKHTDDYAFDYVMGDVKKFEIFVTKDEYESFMVGLNKLKDDLSKDNNSDAIIQYITDYGKN